MRVDPVAPGLQSRAAYLSGDEFMAECDGRRLALFLVARADLRALVVGHERQRVGAGQGAASEFDRGSEIEERASGQEQVFVCLRVDGAHDGGASGHVLGDRAALAEQVHVLAQNVEIGRRLAAFRFFRFGDGDRFGLHA